jgi:hypothetical protein
MAGDWIKVRCDLQTHPKVVRILSAIRRQDVQGVSDKFRVIGGLHAVWTVFDQHSTDGKLTGYTPEIMDHVIGFDGFSQAMIDVGWLEMDGDETLVMPEFTEHNGKSGKRRAEDQKRKRDARKTSANSPQDDGQDADKKRTREEKRRSNTPLNPPKGKSKRGERIPDNFPTDDDLLWATQEFPAVDHNHESAKFRDYWISVPGQKGCKLDWQATWRNWIRRAAENGKGKTQTEPNPPSRKVLN